MATPQQELNNLRRKIITDVPIINDTLNLLDIDELSIDSVLLFSSSVNSYTRSLRQWQQLVKNLSPQEKRLSANMRVFGNKSALASAELNMVRNKLITPNKIRLARVLNVTPRQIDFYYAGTENDVKFLQALSVENLNILQQTDDRPIVSQILQDKQEEEKATEPAQVEAAPIEEPLEDIPEFKTVAQEQEEEKAVSAADFDQALAVRPQDIPRVAPENQLQFAKDAVIEKLQFLNIVGATGRTLDPLGNFSQATDDIRDLSNMVFDLNLAIAAIRRDGLEADAAIINNVRPIPRAEEPEEPEFETKQEREVKEDPALVAARDRFDRDFPVREITGSIDDILINRGRSALAAAPRPAIPIPDVDVDALTENQAKIEKIRNIVSSFSNRGIPISVLEIGLLAALDVGSLDQLAVNLKTIGLDITGFLTGVSREVDAIEFEEEIKSKVREQQKALSLTTQDIKEQIADLINDNKIRDELPNDRIKLRFILNELLRQEFRGVRPDLEISHEPSGRGFQLKNKPKANPRRIKGLVEQPLRGSNLNRFAPRSRSSGNLPPSRFKSGLISGATSTDIFPV